MSEVFIVLATSIFVGWKCSNNYVISRTPINKEISESHSNCFHCVFLSIWQEKRNKHLKEKGEKEREAKVSWLRPFFSFKLGSKQKTNVDACF
jgi:hypothetical protein